MPLEISSGGGAIKRNCDSLSFDGKKIKGHGCQGKISPSKRRVVRRRQSIITKGRRGRGLPQLRRGGNLIVGRGIVPKKKTPTGQEGEIDQSARELKNTAGVPRRSRNPSFKHIESERKVSTIERVSAACR